MAPRLTHEKFKPSPNNIRVNDIKELRGKLDFDSLPPADQLAIRSAIRIWLDYLRTLPQFSKEFAELDKLKTKRSKRKTKKTSKRRQKGGSGSG